MVELRKFRTINSFLKYYIGIYAEKSLDNILKKYALLIARRIVNDIGTIDENIHLLGNICENQTIHIKYLFDLVLSDDLMEKDIIEAKKYLVIKLNKFNVVKKYLKVQKYQQVTPAQLMMEITGQLIDIGFAKNIAISLRMYAKFWNIISNTRFNTTLLTDKTTIQYSPAYHKTTTVPVESITTTKTSKRSKDESSKISITPMTTVMTTTTEPIAPTMAITMTAATTTSLPTTIMLPTILLVTELFTATLPTTTTTMLPTTTTLPMTTITLPTTTITLPTTIRTLPMITTAESTTTSAESTITIAEPTITTTLPTTINTTLPTTPTTTTMTTMISPTMEVPIVNTNVIIELNRSKIVTNVFTPYVDFRISEIISNATSVPACESAECITEQNI
ncbi:ZAN protein, partial [Acromyrmex insinuator]